MTDVFKLARIQIIVIALFAFFKFIRPSVLESHPNEWVKITLLSLPNFFEAIVGVLILTAIGLSLNQRILSTNKQLQSNSIYLLAVLLAGIYVLTQEFKIHNLGGNNVFDQNDVVFSIVGLIVGYLVIRRMKPTLT